MMYAQGYRFASLSAGPPPDLGPQTKMLPDWKPKPAWYFSEIEEHTPPTPTAEYHHHHHDYKLAWAEWCLYENFQVPQYAVKPICFAKFNLEKLISDGYDLSKYVVPDSSSFCPRYNWEDIRADGFHGVQVIDHHHASWRGGGWGLPTIATWNPQGCVHDLQIFQNAKGKKGWTYMVPEQTLVALAGRHTRGSGSSNSNSSSGSISRGIMGLFRLNPARAVPLFGRRNNNNKSENSKPYYNYNYAYY